MCEERRKRKLDAYYERNRVNAGTMDPVFRLVKPTDPIHGSLAPLYALTRKTALSSGSCRYAVQLGFLPIVHDFISSFYHGYARYPFAAHCSSSAAFVLFILFRIVQDLSECTDIVCYNYSYAQKVGKFRLKSVSLYFHPLIIGTKKGGLFCLLKHS